MSFPICGAHSKSTGQACKNKAGKGTDHVGEGPCRKHGGATPVKHGRYSKVNRTRIGKRIAEIQNDPNLLDMTKELAWLKALSEQAMEDYQKHEAALLAWHRAESPLYQTAISLRASEQVIEALKQLQQLEVNRPKQRPDAKIIAELIDKIGKTQERIRKSETVVTRSQLIHLYNDMAEVVLQHSDPETTRKIRDGWMNLQRRGR